MKDIETQHTKKENESAPHDVQINLHIAEYNALTNRCTNFTYIENVVLSLIVVWITTMIGLWIAHPDSFYIAWGALFGTQVFGIIFATLVYEQYNMVRYIESYLRPLLIKFAHSKDIWYYETFLDKQRKSGYRIGEFSSVIIIGILLIILVIIRKPWNIEDLIGLILNLLALVILTLKIYDGAKIRWNHWRM